MDDIQWIDQDSLDLLRILMQPHHAPPVLWVATMRTEYTDDFELNEFLPNLETLELTELLPEEAKELCDLCCAYTVPTRSSPPRQSTGSSRRDKAILCS